MKHCNTCKEIINRKDVHFRLDYWENEDALIEIFFCSEECIDFGITVMENEDDAE